MATIRKIPLRRCSGCGEMKPKKELIRVIHTPEDTIELDLTGKKNGRGAYVCRSAACLQRAIKQKQLERQLETSLGEETAQRLAETLAALTQEAQPGG